MKPAGMPRLPRRRGFSLIEVLVTLVLLSIGLLGMAGMQVRASAAEMESYQRAQALILAQDMVDRIAANKVQAANYVGDDYGTGAVADCSGKLAADLDLCEWGNALRGTSETRLGGTVNIGTLLGGRACIGPARDAAGATIAGQYAVTVAWQGMVRTQAPAVACGKDQFGPEALRRAVVALVQIATLT